jgi:hypothetical protein
MKIGSWTLTKASVALLLIQGSIVSTIAAKYFYERQTCPRVWARTVAIDPELPMRGRYLSLRLTVDGCQSTLPSAKAARFPRGWNGAAVPGDYSVRYVAPILFPAELKVENNQLVAVEITDEEREESAAIVEAPPGAACQQFRLAAPVDYYIAEHVADPSWTKAGQELWIEVTLPPKGPPRPLALALKDNGDNGVWKPLAF